MQKFNIILLFSILFLLVFSLVDNMYMVKEGINDVKAVNSFNEREKDQIIKDTVSAMEIEVMRQNLMTERAAKELLQKELSDYKKLNAFIKAELVTSINDLRIEFSGAENPEIPISILSSDSTLKIDTVRKYFMRSPQHFSQHDEKWYSLSGKVDRKGILFDTISFINKFDITVGYKIGKRIWNKSEAVVELKSYNPYTTVPYINNIVVKENKTPWYYSRIAFFMYGIGTGLGLSSIKNN